MSIFGSIMSKIFGSGHADASTASASTQAGGGSGTPGAASSNPGAAGGTSSASLGTAGGQQVDVGKILADLNAKHGGKLNYKQSIVDMMTLLGMDSSLTARKALADELHYTGDKNDTYTMNVWLMKQVTQKLAENGGTLPDDMKHA